MAFRAQFFETITAPLGNSNGVIPIEGMSAIPYVCNQDGSDGPQAPAFVDTSSPDTILPVSDNLGRVAFYLDPGNYNIHFEDQNRPPRIKSFVRDFTSVSVISASEIATLNGYISDLDISQWHTYGLSIPGQDFIPSSAYSLLATADSLPSVNATGTRNLIGVWYRAVWQESVAGAAKAAIFINNNQLVVPSNGGPVAQAAMKLAGTAANFDTPLSSYPAGLITFLSSPTSYSGDVVTGQAQAIVNSNGNLSDNINNTSNQRPNAGGPCWIVSPGAGTFQISVRYLVTSGSGLVKNRVLRAASIPFPTG